MYLVIELLNNSRWSLYLKLSGGKSVVRNNYRDEESVQTKAHISDCTFQHTRDIRQTSSVRLMILPALVSQPRFISDSTPRTAHSQFADLLMHLDYKTGNHFLDYPKFASLFLLLLFLQDPQSISSSSDLQCNLCSVPFLWIPGFITQGIWFITWEYNLRHGNTTFRMAEWKDMGYNETALTCCCQKVADVPAGEGSPSQQCSVELRTQWERTHFLN